MKYSEYMSIRHALSFITGELVDKNIFQHGSVLQLYFAVTSVYPNFRDKEDCATLKWFAEKVLEHYELNNELPQFIAPLFVKVA